MNRVLYIEDQESAQELFERLYQSAHDCYHGDVEFVFALSWEEAESIVHGPNQIDAVIVDLKLMPSEFMGKTTRMMTAEDSITEIAEKTDTWPPFIVLTEADERTEHFRQLRRRCLLMGAEGIITKREVVSHPERLCQLVYEEYLKRLRKTGVPK